ncbi:MAG: hypothetical protein R3253_04230, partial [Longimicrobiales bacterium]|nr:hypothetical protein [Longimicrobiales bacterium]
EDRWVGAPSVDWGMRFQITVRYGGSRQRYHTFVLEARDAADALRDAAEEMPPEIARDADLVELRIAVDPDDRTYLGEESG